MRADRRPVTPRQGTPQRGVLRRVALRRVVLRRAAVILPVVTTAQMAGIGAAAAAPDPCKNLSGVAFDVCKNGVPVNPVDAATPTLDPLGSIAENCAKAAGFVIGKLAETVNATTRVDFANPGFVRQYAVVFGAATFLTVILWLIAVAKRAIHGVPVGRAVSEAIGFLWMAVLASAFTPVILSMMVTLTDAVTEAIASVTRTDTQHFLNGFADALDPSGFGGGPIMVIFVSLLALAAAAVIWVELVIRAAMLYVGAILGVAVYSGLVDRDLWHHVRRWAGLMVAIDLTKPVIIIVLGLATAVTSNGGTQDAFSSVLTGLAIMFLSIFASVIIYRFVPTFGDDMASLHRGRTAAAVAGPAAVINGPATLMRQGIQTHAGRRASARASGGATAPAAAGAIAGGVAAHSSRGSQAIQHAQNPPSPPRPAPPPPPRPSPPPPGPAPARTTRNGGSP